MTLLLALLDVARAAVVGALINPMASGTSHAMFAEAMGIDWIPAGGFRPTQFLREAIPPAYTEFIGAHLLAAVKAAA